MSPQEAVKAATLENPPPVLTKTDPTIIHGLDLLTADPSAIGASGDTEENNTTPSGQVEQQPAESQVQTEQQQVEPQTPSVDERVKSDPELAKFLEAERSRAISGYIKKRDTEVIEQKLQADRQQRDEALKTLANTARNGATPEERDEALKMLGETTAAQVLHEFTAQEVLTQWYLQAEAATQKVVGDRPDLSVQNFKSIDEWLEAVTAAKLETVKAELEAQKTLAVDKLSEAKAVDIVSAQRQHLPSPDLTQPVAGGGTPRKWNTYSEAAALFSKDEIDINEMSMARQWLDEDRIRYV